MTTLDAKVAELLKQVDPEQLLALLGAKAASPTGSPSPHAPKKYVYYFSPTCAEGNAKMKNQLGGKGANLAEMASIGLPVPPGFTLSAELCDIFYSMGGNYPQEVKDQVASNLKKLEVCPTSGVLSQRAQTVSTFSHTLVVFLGRNGQEVR